MANTYYLRDRTDNVTAHITTPEEMPQAVALDMLKRAHQQRKNKSAQSRAPERVNVNIPDIGNRQLEVKFL